MKTEITSNKDFGNFYAWKKKRFCLELNSHSLSYFQLCPRRFELSELSLLTGVGSYYPFKRGAAISKYLAWWYMAKQKHYSERELEVFENKLFKRMARDKGFIKGDEDFDDSDSSVQNAQRDDRFHVGSRLMGYFNKYRKESHPIISVEKGFSKIIYEDKHVLFVYSGKPDLVLDFGTLGIGPMDHKSESRKSDIFLFNNQFMGYCWALSTNYGVVNYIGLQNDPGKDNKVFRRVNFNFKPGVIDRWKSDTIETFFRARNAIVRKDFYRTWNCEGKYSPCLYHPICTADDTFDEGIKRNKDFIKLEKPYRSW